MEQMDFQRKPDSPLTSFHKDTKVKEEKLSSRFGNLPSSLLIA